MKKIRALFGALSVLFLLACGGGGGVDRAQVLSISTTQPLQYAQVGQIQVAGTHLDGDFSLSAPGCATLSVVAGGSATAQSFSCLVNTATALTVTASGPAGALLSATLPVPDPQVTLLTSKGSILVSLFPAKAPLTVNNFLKYVNDGFYNRLIFHRVIAGYISQGGAYDAALVPKVPTYAPIALESHVGLNNLRGTLAMARTSAFDSATSQFYINTSDNAFLNYASPGTPGYAVFGQVVDAVTPGDSQAVVDAINAVATGTRNNMEAVPVADVLIISAQQTR
jgi:cyclophilin family peptidyl-prolyl cis-trans isomerase